MTQQETPLYFDNMPDEQHIRAYRINMGLPASTQHCELIAVKETKMTNKNTLKRVKKIITEHLGVKNIEPETRIQEDLGADSLDCVELVMAFEEGFDIHIPDDRVDETKTVREICDLIEGLLNE